MTGSSSVVSAFHTAALQLQTNTNTQVKLIFSHDPHIPHINTYFLSGLLLPPPLMDTDWLFW